LPESDYLLMLLASFLKGNNKDQKCYVFVNKTENSQNSESSMTKLSKLFLRTVGQYALRINSELFQSNRLKVLDLSKIRSLFVETLDNKLPTRLLKELSSGDFQQNNKIGGHRFYYRPHITLAYLCDCLPYLTQYKNDAGIWRRLRLIELNPNDLNYELLPSANAYVLLQKFRLYAKNGLTEPKSVEIATSSYRQSFEEN
jgi:hypothetical protein